MIHSIQIQGYRGFERFEMTGLGRLNLLVGTNNSGKTSVLEAIHLLMARAEPGALWQLLWRRGERLAIPVPTLNGHREDNRISWIFAICLRGTRYTPVPNFRFSLRIRSRNSRLRSR